MKDDSARGACQEGVEIRPYRASDRDAVRRICVRTAFRNRGLSGIFEDEELFADYFTSYYTDFEPGSAMVAEVSGEIAGYLLGCLDTRRFLRLMGIRIVPRIALLAGFRLVSGRYREPGSRRFLLWLATRAAREAPRVPVLRYPAHYHINVLPEGYGRRLYSLMSLLFVNRAMRRGVAGLHGIALDTAENYILSRLTRTYSKINPGWIDYYDTRPTSLGRDVLLEDVPLVNRVFGFKIEDYRAFLLWIHRRFPI